MPTLRTGKRPDRHGMRQMRRGSVRPLNNPEPRRDRKGKRQMTPEEIKAAVHAALTEHKEAFWIEAEQHYEDHKAILRCRSQENEKDHEFVRGVREKKETAIKIGWGMIVVSGVGFAGLAMWERLAHLLKGVPR